MLEQGIICPGTSPFSAPVLLVKKADSGVPPGRLNSAVDALSRCDADTADAPRELHALSRPSFCLLNDIRDATAADPEATRLLQQLLDASLGAPWTTNDGFLLHGKRIFVPAQHDLRHQVIALAHAADHEGIQKTLMRLREVFYIPGDRGLVQDFVRACVTCQSNKTPTL
ncbi:uncharacterized protein [Miscanthus floridulus]|uniref:uncharacterized protein n=1 Tax=Miscanthus floridulus TaxID=154761 RepID=UPI003457FE17